jgi:hypothetical protein
MRAGFGVNRGERRHGSFAASRASRIRTVVVCQSPPRAERNPSAFNAAAIARGLVMPLVSKRRWPEHPNEPEHWEQSFGKSGSVATANSLRKG